MVKILNSIKTIYKETKDFHSQSPSSIFKLFVAAVLVQFAVLSLVRIEIDPCMNVLPSVERVASSVYYWWGLLGLYGAFSLVFERYIRNCVTTLVIGYVASISSLTLLSYDFITTEPPSHTGGVLAATAVVFLGGLLYGGLRHR